MAKTHKPKKQTKQNKKKKDKKNKKKEGPTKISKPYKFKPQIDEIKKKKTQIDSSVLYQLGLVTKTNESSLNEFEVPEIKAPKLIIPKLPKLIVEKKVDQKQDDVMDEEMIEENENTINEENPKEIFESEEEKELTEAEKHYMNAIDKNYLEDAPGTFFFSKCTRGNTRKSIFFPNNHLWTMNTLSNYGWDQWGSTPITCRCMDCELREIVPNLKLCKTLIIVDLDNWGLDILSTQNPTWMRDDVILNSYLWAFYGHGLRRKGIDIAFKGFGEIFDKYASNNFNTDQVKCVFDKYAKFKHLRFSPAGANKEAADLAILKMFQYFINDINVIIISSDKLLGKGIEDIYKKEERKFKFKVISPAKVPRVLNAVKTTLKQFGGHYNL